MRCDASLTRIQIESSDDEDFDPNKPASDGDDGDGDDDDDANSIIDDDDNGEKDGDDEAPRRSKHKHADLSEFSTISLRFCCEKRLARVHFRADHLIYCRR